MADDDNNESLYTASDPDPDPGSASPTDPTTTEVPPTAGSDDSTATGNTHDDAEYTKQLENQFQTDVKRSEAHAHDQQQYIDNIQKQMADLQGMQPPQPLQQIPPASQDQKGQVTSRVLQVLAIAGVAFSLFGKRRNGYAQGALMGGLGSLIQGYMQGNHEQHNQNTKNWHQLNESIIKENQDRMNQYKAILGNKKLNLEEQMKLMAMKGKFYESNRMESNAQKQDLAAIHKHIAHMADWQDKHRANAIMSKADKAKWAALVLEKSDGQADVYTPEGLKWAYKNYPPSQFYNDEKTTYTTDPNTGKQSKTIGGFSGKEPEKQAQTDLDRRMDEKFGKIRTQASPSPSPSPDQKKSVFDRNDFSSPDTSDTGDDGSGL
jgi:hypothetical protein